MDILTQSLTHSLKHSFIFSYSFFSNLVTCSKRRSCLYATTKWYLRLSWVIRYTHSLNQSSLIHSHIVFFLFLCSHSFQENTLSLPYHQIILKTSMVNRIYSLIFCFSLFSIAVTCFKKTCCHRHVTRWCLKPPWHC